MKKKPLLQLGFEPTVDAYVGAQRNNANQLTNVFGPPQKPWLLTEKNKQALAMPYLASGPLLNAANSRVVPTEYAAEPFNIDICYSSQLLNFTSVKLNRFAKQAKLLKKKPLFQKRRRSCNFPPRKMVFCTPRRVVLGIPTPSPRVCKGGRSGGHTLTSQPNFLASIGYQICLAMVLRWHTMRAGFAISDKVLSTMTKLRLSIGDSDSL